MDKLVELRLFLLQLPQDVLQCTKQSYTHNASIAHTTVR
jgi:hypothetical protein